MTDHVYKIEDFVGSSSEGQDAAIRNAIARAARAHAKLRWFVVTESRGQIVDGSVSHWQVTVRVGIAMD